MAFKDARDWSRGEWQREGQEEKTLQHGTERGAVSVLCHLPLTYLLTILLLDRSCACCLLPSSSAHCVS